MASDWRILNKLGPPRPPSALNKETVGVWNGWGGMGDKEVAREAAAKGLHVDLAITFLSLRKNLEVSQAKDWFRNEVVKWAKELVDRKQIFKASHILNNTGLDAVAEFVKVFRETTNTQLRDYVGNHLSKIEKFDDNMRNLLNFLRLIIENSQLISPQLSEINIKCLETQNNAWKSKTASAIFLKTDDARLIPFLTPEALWEQLLVDNDVELLRIWINLRYNANFNVTLESKLIGQFRKFAISSEMLNFVANVEFDVSIETQNLIFNELSKFGIFREIEAKNLLVILKRLKDSASIGRIYEIFSQSISVVDVDSFLRLLVEFCEKNELYSILNACLRNFELSIENSKHLHLINDFRGLVASFSEDSLKENILNVIDAFCGDFATYFSDYPIMLLAFISVTKNLKLVELIFKRIPLLVRDINLDKCFVDSVRKLPILEACCFYKTTFFPMCDLTLYDLVDIHMKVNPRLLFKFRYGDDQQLPNLNYKSLVQTYGYTKTINYKFHLKQATPSTAASLFISNQLQMYKFVNKEDLKIVERKVCKLAINNFNSDEITSSCVTFLELIKIDSFELRVKVKIAKLMQESGFDKESILVILLQSNNDPYTLQSILETIITIPLRGIEINSGSRLIEIMKSLEIVLQYSKLNNLKLPELFLKNLASSNLWLPLLLIAQINNYPIEQMKLITQFFKNPTLTEHVTHSVLNDVYVEEKDFLMEDSRKHFLSKLKVYKSTEVLSENLSLHSTNSQSSDNSTNSSDSFEIDVSIKATLLQTLIRCHNSTDPPKALLQACQMYRNPMLAIFATTYEPDSIVANWLTWLAVSCELCHTFTNYESVAMSANSVTDLLENCVREKFPRALHESFEIFLPANPLKIFVEFLNDLIKFEFDSSVLSSKLQKFQASLKNTRKNSVINEADREMTYLNNRNWVETTALKLLSAGLQYNCNSLYEQILIIEAVSHVEIWNYFSVECPNFLNILEILRSLSESHSGVRLDITFMFDSQNRRQTVINCVNALLEKQSYAKALEIAQMENLPPDLVLTKEWESKFESRSQENFWINCDRVFNEFKVTADCVVEFYVNCSEKIESLFEKYSVLKLATKWATKFELSRRFELEKKMWLSFLYLDEKFKSYDDLGIKAEVCLYCDVVDSLKTIPQNDIELTKDFVKQIDRLIIFSLNKGNFWQALKLQKMFGCKSTDLETLKLSHSLAEGLIQPYQLNAEQRLLLTNVSYLRNYSHRRTFLSTRLSSFSSCSHHSHSPANSSLVQTISEDPDCTKNDTLVILKLLSEHLHNGARIGQNVFMTYRIAINIEIPYLVVIASSDYLKMLKDSLEDDCMNKLDVIHDFIAVYKWSRSEIADFICEALVNAISLFSKSNQTRLIMWDLDLDHDFPSVLQLLQENCSILGHKIYSYASAIHRSQIESESTCPDFVLIIELMIRAHDCFTADCNMEGISIILKKSKELISNLLTRQNWKLIVRLLTGVARYTEMNYVFQILMQNDQFEFLLRKGSCKDNTFKMALLEYLKKYCPENRELYRIVALHFTLFSEVAMLWEREAQSVINHLIMISKLEMQNNKINPDEEPFVLFQNTDGTRMCLKKSMDNYTHATEFHLQGDKLAKATEASKQAELIALQISLLNEVSSSKTACAICVLNLTNDQINAVISTKLGFEQSLILVEAYNFQVDWSTVLYEQYVVRNNLKFLEGFLQHLPLTDGLVHDISRKFINSEVNNIVEIRGMKSILSRMPSVHFKYKIASELGFTDLVQDLIESGQLVYLRDTVWKRGYRN